MSIEQQRNLLQHRQMTGRHTPRNPRSLLETLDSCYYGLSSKYARVSTLMVGTQQVVGKQL